MTLSRMSESEWTKILGWPGYRVYRSEINEDSKTVRLWNPNFFAEATPGNLAPNSLACGTQLVH